MKVVTIIGTRPEIIRLVCIIKKLDLYFEHILVHTGQNWDTQLNDVFFNDWIYEDPITFSTLLVKIWVNRWEILSRKVMIFYQN